MTTTSEEYYKELLPWTEAPFAEEPKESIDLVKEQETYLEGNFPGLLEAIKEKDEKTR